MRNGIYPRRHVLAHQPAKALDQLRGDLRWRTFRGMDSVEGDFGSVSLLFQSRWPVSEDLVEVGHSILDHTVQPHHLALCRIDLTAQRGDPSVHLHRRLGPP